MIGVGVLVLAAACGSSDPSPSTTTSRPTPSAAATSAAPTPSAGSTTVWLCRPDDAADPCHTGTSATVVSADGTKQVQPAARADPGIDCFYVYPTVSRDHGLNSDLSIDPEERVVAVAQASRFSSVCRVYAPMYRQLTTSALGGSDGKVTPAAALTAYLSVEHAWEDYLAHDNDGRGVVLIGHSQGAFLLDALIKRVIDTDPAQRRLLVSALLLGGNVRVPDGKEVGGDFQHVPACTAPTQTGCVVAYSTYQGDPPKDAYFGRTDTSVAAVLGLDTGSGAGEQVLCTNPGALGGGVAALDTYLPTTGSFGLLGAIAGLPQAATPWVAYPGRYRAQCEQKDGASWLDVTPANDARPLLQAYLEPQWGLHLYDVNIALGNLVQLVGTEAHAYHR